MLHKIISKCLWRQTTVLLNMFSTKNLVGRGHVSKTWMIQIFPTILGNFIFITVPINSYTWPEISNSNILISQNIPATFFTWNLPTTMASFSCKGIQGLSKSYHFSQCKTQRSTIEFRFHFYWTNPQEQQKNDTKAGTKNVRFVSTNTRLIYVCVESSFGLGPILPVYSCVFISCHCHCQWQNCSEEQRAE